MVASNPPPGYESHNHFLMRAGIPYDLYYARLQAGDDPMKVAMEPFDINPSDGLPKWDADWPCKYKGTVFTNYRVMCDHLESIGVLRRYTPKPMTETTSIYDLPERSVLQWLSATGRLDGPDADLWIARVVAPLRNDSQHNSNIRANKRHQVDSSKCSQCQIDLTGKPEQVFIRPKVATDPAFLVALRRKGFDPTKYEAWCRSCAARDRWAKRR